PRDFHDRLHLSLLVADRHAGAVSVRRGLKATLWTEGQLLDRDELRRLVDAPQQLVLRLDLVRLSANQAEHRDLVARHVTQRLEASRSRRVELEQEAVDVLCVEHLLGDEVIAAAATRPADPVASTEMEGER